MNTSQTRCPVCGGGLTAAGFCARCVLAGTDSLPARELPEAASDARYEPGTAVRYFGHFELLDQGREGGMGVVYHARHVNLKREVALKMILGHCLRSADLVRRFRREVEVLARMDHPNVLPILEVGEQRGQHFYSMKWVAEGSLADQFGQWRLSGPGEVKERERRLVELLLGITRGVQHAHQRGILHRDLKLANVLVDAAGQPYVADFGLAKWAEDEEGGKTQTRAGLGSPPYMSPEQAAGGQRELTTATDVWALGVIFHELLTGRRPFVGSNNAEILKRVLESEPEAPRRVDPRIDRDLETICQKCLEKEPGRRYASAEGLGDDLARWLRGEPITARPVTGLERLGKWARRRPVVAGWIGATVLALALGLVGTLWQWRQARENARLEKDQRALAEERADAIRHGYYAAKVVVAQQALVERRYDVAQAHLDEFVPGPGQADIRGFSWRLVNRLLENIRPIEWLDESVLEGVHAVAQDGSLLATVNEMRQIKVWHLDEHRLIAAVPALNTSILALAFSADARWLVGADSDATLYLWETASGQELQRLTVDTPLVALSWTSSAGIVGLAKDGLLKGWDERLENERDIRQFTFERIELATFSPNGAWVAMTGDEGLLVAQWILPVEPLRFGGYQGTLHALAFSTDGHWLAATGMWESAPRVWRLPKGEPGRPLAPGLPGSTSVSFFSRTAEVIAGSVMGGVRVWELDTGRSRADWFGHKGAVHGVVAPPGRGFLVSWGGDDKRIRSWDLSEPAAWAQGIQIPSGNAGAIGGDLLHIAFSQDGQQLWACNYAVGLTGWQVNSRQRFITQPLDPETATRQVAETFGLPSVMDGSQLVRWPLNGPGEVWDLNQGERIATFDKPGRVVTSAARSTQGPMLATGDGLAGRIDLWSISEGHLGEIGMHQGIVFAVAFHPNGTILASGGQDAKVRIWDVSARREVRALTPGEMVTGLRFSPDGQVLVVATTRGDVGFWRVSDWELLKAVPVHQGGVVALAFSPDGKVLATGGADALVQIWEQHDWTPSIRLESDGFPVVALAFAPDGGTLAVGDTAQYVRLWRAEPADQAD